MGGDVDGEEGFSDAGVADDEGEFCERDSAGPEPIEGIGFDFVSEIEVGEEVGRLWLVVHGWLQCF